jgi:uncharacterized protein YoxC
MKLFYRMYFVLIITIFFGCYYSYADEFIRPMPITTPDKICAGGSATGTTTTQLLTADISSGSVDRFGKTWNSGNLNNNVPYLFSAEPNQIWYVISASLSGTTLTINYQNFNCSCDNGIDKFGQCLPTFELGGGAEIIKCNDGTTPITIEENQNLSIIGNMSTPTWSTSVYDGAGIYANWTDASIYSEHIANNYDMVPLAVPYYSDKALFKGYLEEYNNAPYYKTYYINAGCNYGGIQKYQIGYKIHYCPVPCADGGPFLNGTCDRTCEDIGMISSTADNLTGVVRCITPYDCTTSLNDCISTCGGSENVELFACSQETGITTPCQCKEQDTTDQNPDTTNDTTDGTDNIDSNNTTDMTETNSLLTTANQYQSEANDLLMQNNSLLNDTNTNLNNINNGINDMNSNLGLKLDTLDSRLAEVGTKLNSELEESNGWLSDILSKLTSLYDWLIDNSNNLTTQSNDLKSSIDDEIANRDGIDDLDLQGETTTALDSVTSKYTNALGLSTSYGSRPANIDLTLEGKTYTLVDFSYLDSYITIIRGLFLSIAYLLGFLILLKKD